MEETVFAYLGDDMFHKLGCFLDKSIPLNRVNLKIFNSVKASPKIAIEDIYLGWSYILYRTGNKYFHVGFPCSKGETVEMFKSQAKDLNVTCGENVVYAFSRDGDIFCYSTENLKEFPYPKNRKQKNSNISVGERFTIVLSDDGKVSLLSIEGHISEILLPVITQVACGKEHVIFLSDAGQVFSYGSGSRGQLGLGTIENEDKPVLLEALDGIKIKAISCGGWHSAALSEAGDLYIWGWNESGQLGFPCTELHGDVLPLSDIETICFLPKIVEFEEEKLIKFVSCGTRHTAVLTDDFQVWTWGSNKYNQLGHCKETLCDKPCKVSFPDKLIPKKIKCAFWSTLVICTLNV